MAIRSGKSGKAGKFIVFSSPSGGGKSTIIEYLLKKHENFTYSISATTRPPRSGEINGKSYWFQSKDEFIKMRERGGFLEWEEVYGDYYGTPKEPAEEAAAAGLHVLFDLDVKGALKLKKALPEALLIFLLPPSFEILARRLRKRGTENKARLQHRMAQARWECQQASKFDYIIVNNDLDITFQTVENIIRNRIQEDGSL